MLTLPLEEHSCGRRAKYLQKSYWAPLNRWKCADQGQVAVLFALVIFLGMSFVGIALDYGRYVAGKEKIRSFMDQTAARGAGTCRRYFLQEINKPGGNFNNALQEGINYARDESARHMQQQVSRTFRGTDLWIDEYTNVTYDVRPLLKPNGPNPNQDYCSVAITYNGRVATTFSALFGVKEWKARGRVVALSALTGGGGAHLEIDFLFDVSGSMSTISNPIDRDIVMLFTASPESISPEHRNGCIFICHARRALLPAVPSNIIEKLDYDRPVPSFPVHYRSSGPSDYDGGTVNVSRRPSTPSWTYRYTSPATASTPYMSNLKMIGDVLKHYNIRLKSDDMHRNMEILIQKLQTAASGRAEVAFHKFSTGPFAGFGFQPRQPVIRTLVPRVSSLSSDNLVPVSNITPRDVVLENFDYDVPDRPGSEDTPYFFGTQVNTSFAAPNRLAVGGANAVPFSTVSLPTDSLPQAGKFSTLSSGPLSWIEMAVDDVHNKILRRPPPSPQTKRVVILFSDGVQSTTARGGQLMNPAQCEKLKNAGVIVMIVHSYYRFQPGAAASDGLFRVIRPGAPRLMRSNIDALEESINKVEIRESLIKCASPKEDVQPGEEPFYYFPANNTAQIDAAFTELLDALLTIPGKGSPILVIE